jgi:fructose-1,6-bisphosphatase/inositol monophosphatase family enzyme
MMEQRYSKRVQTPFLGKCNFYMFDYTNNDLKSWLQTAIDAGLKAGNIIKEALKKQRMTESKENPADLVTVTDKAVEEFLFQYLKNCYPDHRFVGEETSAMTGETVGELDDVPTWIIDPVDGTTNFVHGFPFFCVAIGLAVNKVPVVGVVYNPKLRELFYASQNHGAFLVEDPVEVTVGEGMRLNGSSLPLPETLSYALIATEYGSSKAPDLLNPKIDIIKNIITNPIAGRGIRSIGSAEMHMCLIAQGAIDIYYEAGTHAWDVCAGAVIIKESGGHVYNWMSSGEFDLLERTIIAVRGDGTKRTNKAPLVEQLESALIYIHYPRD